MSDAGKAAFLSYAREDTDAARNIADALRAAGVEVWFDQSELRGGDAWDANIRQQIRECALFLPIISANTQARPEGYFRLEWKLADRRTDLIGKSKAFLVPVCIDDTRESGADVPDSFLAVHWTRLRPAGYAGQARDEVRVAGFCEWVRRLLERGAGSSSHGSEQALPGPGALEHGQVYPPLAAGDATWVDRPTTSAASPVARESRPRRWLVSGLFGAALIVAALALWHPWRKADAPSPPAAAKPPLDFAPAKSIAVLAFKNLSDDKAATEYFSDGISEELLNVLARVPGLKVSASSSSFHFKNKDLQLAEIARQLNVTYLVEGSVRMYDNRVRISAKLIKATDGFTVWSSPNLDRELKNVLSVQDEIAGLIAQNLELTLGGAPRTTRTVNPQAHQLVLEGRHYLNLRPQFFVEAEKAFTNAAEIDAQFAPAHSGLADLFSLRGVWWAVEGEADAYRDFSRVSAAAERAIALDPSMAEPHAALGLMNYMVRRLDDSERNFSETFRLNPNYAQAHHWHGLPLALQGRFDEGMAALERSTNLDPFAHTALFTYGSYLFAANRLEEALRALDRSIAIKSFLASRGVRAVTLLKLGRDTEARAEARLVRQSTAPPRWWADGDAVYVLKRAGAPGEAEEYVRALRARLPAQSHLLGYVLCALGNLEEGLPLLETVEPMCQTRLYFMPFFDALQGTSQFEQLFAKLNSTKEYRTARETLARLRAAQTAK